MIISGLFQGAYRLSTLASELTTLTKLQTVGKYFAGAPGYNAATAAMARRGAYEQASAEVMYDSLAVQDTLLDSADDQLTAVNSLLANMRELAVDVRDNGANATLSDNFNTYQNALDDLLEETSLGGRSILPTADYTVYVSDRSSANITVPQSHSYDNRSDVNDTTAINITDVSNATAAIAAIDTYIADNVNPDMTSYEAAIDSISVFSSLATNRMATAAEQSGLNDIDAVEVATEISAKTAQYTNAAAAVTALYNIAQLMNSAVMEMLGMTNYTFS